MALSIAEFTTQLADLQDDFNEGVIGKAAYQEALADLYAQYDSVGTLSENLSALLAIKAAMIEAYQVLGIRGSVTLVSNLPGSGADGDAYRVTSNGHLYTRVSGAWTDLGRFSTSAWLPVSGNHDAVDGERLLCDTTGGGFTVTLPDEPSQGDEVLLRDAHATFDTHPVIVNRNGLTIGGLTENLTANLPGIELRLLYTGGTWRFSFTTNY